jgi:hypothetical protein
MLDRGRALREQLHGGLLREPAHVDTGDRRPCRQGAGRAGEGEPHGRGEHDERARQEDGAANGYAAGGMAHAGPVDRRVAAH